MLKKRVLVLVPSLDNKGPIIVAKDIADYNKNGYVEFVFVSLKKNKLQDIKEFKKYKIYEIINWKVLFLTGRIKKIIKEIKPDLIHCHCFWPTIMAGIWLKDYKVISTLHNNPIEDYYYEYGKIVSILMAKIITKCEKKIDMNYAISKYVKDIHINLGISEKKIKVIYNGVKTIQNINDKNKEKSNTFNLITISVLNKRKNIEFLIRVAKKLKEKKIDFIFKIIGDGKERKRIEKLVRTYRIEKNIIFLGNITRENAMLELEKSDLFLFSSKSEGYGLVIVESLVHKTPVIVSNLPVMREIVKDGKNGYILELDEEKYVDKIIKLSKDHHKLTELSNYKFEESFLSEKMSESYVNEYFNFFK